MDEKTAKDTATFTDFVAKRIDPALREYAAKDAGDPIHGLMVFMARRLVAQGVDVEEIVEDVRAHAQHQKETVNRKH